MTPAQRRRGPPAAPPRSGGALARVLQVADFLRLHPDRETALQHIVDAAWHALGFEVVVLNLFDPQRQVFDLHAFAGLSPAGEAYLRQASYSWAALQAVMREEFRRGRCYFIPAGRVDWQREFQGPVYTPLADVPGWARGRQPGAWDPLDALFVPIETRQGEIAGLLWLDAPRDGRRPRAATLRGLELFASLAAVALENLRLFQQVQQLTLVDELTGLYNRRGLMQLGSHEFARSRRFGRPLAALFADVDHFREVNNRYSHAVGDEVLRAVAGRCRGQLRAADVAARYGGEEFVALLLESDCAEAAQVAERIRVAVASAPVPTAAGPVSVTLSLGVAEAAGEADDLAALLDRANRAEHRAKEGGRNRVAVA